MIPANLPDFIAFGKLEAMKLLAAHLIGPGWGNQHIHNAFWYLVDVEVTA